MSRQPKKPSGTHSDTPYRDTVRQLLEKVGVSVAEDLLERVSVEHADNPAFIALVEGHRPYHRVCGSLCSFIAAGAFNSPGSISIGVTCPKCLRNLMEGEIDYALDTV